MPPTQVATPSDEQQARLLDESLSIVKLQSFHMKCCLDRGKLMDALKHASNMLNELRTNLLSPKSYYELFLVASDQLRHFEVFLLDGINKGHKLADLYEVVQHAGNIIPRLYLLITVGLVHMKTTPGCRRNILRDLVEMCRGVQHPLRGLFLRHYLLQSCRNILPDVTVEDIATGDGKEDHSGTVQDSIEFVLLNFAEMNKLWVRMQHQGHTRDKERREKERLELRLLVGTNLVRLSQLESIDLERYKNVVLPGILEQVVSCRDGIAQEHLMECLIQVFPDEFQLATLQPFLNSCAQLVPSVNVKNIIIALIDRLAASQDVELPDDLFDTFSAQIAEIIKSRPDMPLEDIILMKGSLINFSIKKIVDENKRQESLNVVLGAVLDVIRDKCDGTKIPYRTSIGRELAKFLKIPITQYEGAATGNGTQSTVAPIKMSLKLSNFKEILKQVTDTELHKHITLSLLNSALDSGTEEKVVEANRLSLEEIEIFLTEICDPLRQGAVIGDEPDEDFIDEQMLLSRFIHYLLSPMCVASDDIDLHYLILSAAKKILAVGGPKRIRFTFPSLVFEALKLSLKYSKVGDENDPKWEKKCSKIFNYVNQTITALNDSNCHDICLRLYLEAAINASKTGVENSETIAYEFASKAFSIFEDEISETKQRLACLLLIFGSIKEIGFKLEENLQPLLAQCPLNASKLVKKPDQCRALLSASLLFCDKESISTDALKCIRKCDKIASTLIDAELKLQLYIEILSHLTLFVKYQNEHVEAIIEQLVEKIEELKKETNLSELIEKQYSNNYDFLKSKNVIKNIAAN